MCFLFHPNIHSIVFAHPNHPIRRNIIRIPVPPPTKLPATVFDALPLGERRKLRLTHRAYRTGARHRVATRHEWPAAIIIPLRKDQARNHYLHNPHLLVHGYTLVTSKDKVESFGRQINKDTATTILRQRDQILGAAPNNRLPRCLQCETELPGIPTQGHPIRCTKCGSAHYVMSLK